MSRRFFKSSLPALLSLFLAAAAPGSEHGRVEEKREPIVITAERMTAARLNDEIEFNGNVLLKKEGVTINSDTATVYYDEQLKGIREIDALGNVVVRKEGRIAYAERAQYFSREEKIVLSGEARIIEHENELGGERITLFLRDDRSIIEGGKVIFYQGAPPGHPEPEDAKRKSEGAPNSAVQN